MNYSDTTPLRGKGTVSAAAIDAWFRSVNRNAPSGLGQAMVDECSAVGFNADLVAAQTALESDYWRSAIARDKNNPAGIGAENDDPYGKAISFTSPAVGIHAQVEHLLTYVLGDGPWGTDDPRFDAVKAAGWLGSVKVLRDLNGRWAFPGTTYGADIAAWANALTNFAEHGVWAMTIPKPPMIERHSPRYDGYGHAREYRAFVDHIATGTIGSNLSWLAGGTADDAQPSVNYYIAKSGDIYEVVPYQHAPWTNGWKTDGDIIATYRPNTANPVVKYWADNRLNPNTGTVSTEHEGEASDRLTAAQITSNAWLKAWLHQETGIPLDRDHWFGHNYIDSVNRPYCPSFDPDEWAALLAQAQARANAQPVPPAPVPPPAPSEPTLILPGQPGDVPFVSGFRAHLLKVGAAVNSQDPALGALAVFGYAHESEWKDADGNAYQETERYFLKWQTGQLPPWDVIGLHRGEQPPAKAKP